MIFVIYYLEFTLLYNYALQIWYLFSKDKCITQDKRIIHVVTNYKKFLTLNDKQ